MLKMYVLLKDKENKKQVYYEELRHLRPRIYMISWNYEKILKYAKEEIYWNDIEEKNILSFMIEGKTFENYIKKPR